VTEFKHERAVLTIASGKPVYINMGVALARSFRRWHKDSDIVFQFATDQADKLPADVKEFVSVVPFKPGELGEAFTPKLHLDKLTEARKTLFIDADCILYRSLEPLFDEFNEKDFSLIGEMVKQGEFWGNLKERCERFKIPHVPIFFGAVYYFEAGETSKSVFEKARELEPQYDDIGMIRLRGHHNEEPLLGVSMAMHDQMPVEDDGSHKVDALKFQTKMQANVWKGFVHVENKPGHPKHQPQNKLRKASPIIYHYNDSFARTPLYLAEADFLNRVAGGTSEPLAWLLSRMAILWPGRLKTGVRDTFRPLYRKVFGTRKIGETDRC